MELTSAERQWLLTPDPRAYGADTHRASRALTSLLEEYPVSGALAVRSPCGLDHLRRFFTSDLFHDCVQSRGSMAEAFGQYLGSDIFMQHPDISRMAEVELAIAQVRRAPNLRYDPAARVTEATRVRLAPWVRLLSLHPVILPCYSNWLDHLDRAATPRLEAILDTTYRLPPSVPEDDSDLELVLVVGIPGGDGPSLEPALPALGSLLTAAQTETTCRELAQVATELDAEPDEALDIIQDFLADRLLILMPCS